MIDEDIIDEYPSIYTNQSSISDPEFILYVEQYPEIKFGAYSIQGKGINTLLEHLIVRAGLSDEENVKMFCENIRPVLVVEDVVFSKEKKIPYVLFN